MAAVDRKPELFQCCKGQVFTLGIKQLGASKDPDVPFASTKAKWRGLEVEEDPAGNRDDSLPWINSTVKLCLT